MTILIVAGMWRPGGSYGNHDMGKSFATTVYTD